MRKTQNLRYLLTEFARSGDFEYKMLEQKIFVLWGEYFGRGEYLGTPFSTQTVPVSLSNGVLKVYTEYPPYVTHLSLLKEQIIADLNTELGQPVLKDLRIEVHQARKATAPHTRRASAATEMSKSNVQPPTPKELEEVEQAIANVTDADLKTSLQQLFITQIKDKP